MTNHELAAIMESRSLEALSRARRALIPAGDRMLAEMALKERAAEWARYEAYQRCADMLRAESALRGEP